MANGSTDMVSTVLALDLATVTGFAVGDLAAPTASTPVEAASAGALPPMPLSGSQRIGKPGMGDGRFFECFEIWMTDMIAVHNPDVVIFEAPIVHSGKINAKTARRLMGLAVLAELIAHKKGVGRILEGNISQIKKHATGNGRATKPQMIAAARRLGWRPADDNEADALWLLDFAVTILSRKRRAA